MGGRIPETIIHEVLQATDIVDIVAEAVVLKQAGKNLVGLCPFHSEKTPSFTVSPDKQIFYCFGCGEGGNAFAFLMRHQGLSFPEVVRTLAQRYGIRMPDADAGMRAGSDERDRLRTINQAAMDFYGQMLAHADRGRAARDYLAGRGFDPGIIAAFRLGYAPQGWDNLLNHLRRRQVPESMLEKAGLVVARQSGRGCYDRFRERIIFPIIDVNAAVVGFGGRVLGEGLPKYLNSPETPLYNKRRCLYGLYQARQKCREKQAVYIVEGYLDLLALHQYGIQNAVATLGTALTAEQIALLKRFVGSGRIVLVFDGDAAGQKAAERTEPIFKQLHQSFAAGSFQKEKGINTLIMELPAGQDPDSFLHDSGADAFLALAGKAKGVFPFLMDAALRQHGDTIEGRAQAVGQVAGTLKAVEDPVTRALYVKLLAERVGVEEAVILRRIGGAVAAPVAAPAPPKAGLPPLERQVAAMMLQFPTVIQEVDKRQLTSYFSSLRLKAIAEAAVVRFRQTGGIEGLIETLKDPDLQRLASRLMMGDERGTEAGCRKLIGQFELAANRSKASRMQAVANAEHGDDAGELERLLREINLAAKKKDRSKQRLMKR